MVAQKYLQVGCRRKQVQTMKTKQNKKQNKYG